MCPPFSSQASRPQTDASPSPSLALQGEVPPCWLPLSGGWAVGSGEKKKSVLPFAWGSWNCFLPEIYKLGVGRERGQTLESKSHFQSCLNRRDLEAEEDPSDEPHREEAKVSSFLRGGGVVHGRMVGGGCWQGPGVVPRMQPRCLGVGWPGEKGPPKPHFSSVNEQVSHLGVLLECRF